MLIIKTFFKIFGLTLLGFLLLSLLIGFCSLLGALLAVATGSKFVGFVFYLLTSFASFIALIVTAAYYLEAKR